jgi:outer membrane receptor for monomeric catechols
MDLKAYVGAVVADATLEQGEYGDGTTGLALTFTDGRVLRAWSPYECPEEIAITEGHSAGVGEGRADAR